MRKRPESPEDLRRRLTRVSLEAAKRDKGRLFDRLTKNNEGKIAALMKEEAIFSEKKEDAPREILLDESISEVVPQEFFDNPTEWIESQPRIDRGFSEKIWALEEKTIKDVWMIEDDADLNRVKLIEIIGKDGRVIRIVSKRLNPKKDDFQEVVIARKAFESGIPTPKVIGEITHHGNLYAWFEHVPALDLSVVKNRTGNFYSRGDKAIALYEKYHDRVPQEDQERAKELYDRAKELEPLTPVWYDRVWKVGESLVFEYTDIAKKIAESDDLSANQIKGIGEKIIENIKAKIPNDETMQRMLSLTNRNYDHLIYSVYDDVFWKFYTEFNEKFNRRFLPVSEHGADYDKIGESLDKEWDDYQKRRKEFNKSSWQIKLGEKTYGRLSGLIQNSIIDLSETQDQIRALEELCEEKGVKPQDFKDNNILVRWDHENDKPELDANGKPQIMLIDFESPRE